MNKYVSKVSSNSVEVCMINGGLLFLVHFLLPVVQVELTCLYQPFTEHHLCRMFGDEH